MTKGQRLCVFERERERERGGVIDPKPDPEHTALFFRFKLKRKKDASSASPSSCLFINLYISKYKLHLSVNKEYDDNTRIPAFEPQIGWHSRRG